MPDALHDDARVAAAAAAERVGAQPSLNAWILQAIRERLAREAGSSARDPRRPTRP